MKYDLTLLDLQMDTTYATIHVIDITYFYSLIQICWWVGHKLNRNKWTTKTQRTRASETIRSLECIQVQDKFG